MVRVIDDSIAGQAKIPFSHQAPTGRLSLFISLLLFAVCSEDGGNASRKPELLVYCGIKMVKPMGEIARIIEKAQNVNISLSQGGSEDLDQSLKTRRQAISSQNPWPFVNCPSGDRSGNSRIKSSTLGGSRKRTAAGPGSFEAAGSWC